MPLNLKWSTENYLKGKWWLLVADDLQMTVSFICVPFSRVKQKEWGTCKVIHLRTCLKDFSLSARGLRAGCFFSLFFLVILHHCTPPSSLETMHILPGESSNITTLLHRYSSLGSFACSHSSPSAPLSSSLLSFHLIRLSVSQSVTLRFMYFPLPTPSDPVSFLPPLPQYFYFGGAQCAPSPRSLLRALRLAHLPSAYASAYFEVVAHNRYPILMRTLMNFWALIRRLTVR